MPLSEQQLISWSGPVSTTEDQKCKNAVSQVTDAIRAKFGNKVTIFLQGSYRNNTNVRRDSDVDVVVRYNEVFFDDLDFLSEEQKRIYNANSTLAEYTYAHYKNDVHKALNAVFGDIAKRKNKCIEVLENANRVTADVIPCFVHKRFRTATDTSAEGIQFHADDGTNIISFPEQHYRNGVAKTEATSRMYKRTVRILKNIRNKLIENNTITDKLASSFFIECLVYNVPNDHFYIGNYRGTLRMVIAKIFNDMLDPALWNEYEEVSGLKWLFRGGGRTPKDAQKFMDECWKYAGFE